MVGFFPINPQILCSGIGDGDNDHHRHHQQTTNLGIIIIIIFGYRERVYPLPLTLTIIPSPFWPWAIIQLSHRKWQRLMSNRHFLLFNVILLFNVNLIRECSSSSVHHQFIISSSSVDHQLIISWSSVDHQLIISWSLDDEQIRTWAPLTSRLKYHPIPS